MAQKISRTKPRVVKYHLDDVAAAAKRVLAFTPHADSYDDLAHDALVLARAYLEDGVMMNLYEVLAREIGRVGDVRAAYKAMGPVAKIALSMLDIYMETAYKAAGSGDIVSMLGALKDLKTIEL